MPSRPPADILKEKTALPGREELLRTAAALVLAAGLCPGYAAAAAFSDVPAGAWYASAVDYAAEHGLFDGTGEGTFSPLGAMTRGMFVTVLARTAGAEPAGAGESGFSDVSPEAWYGPAVAWAAAAGYVDGVGDGRFAPDAPVTREQIAVILGHCLAGRELGTEEEAPPFADADQVSPWAAEGVALVRAAGLMDGDNQGYFNPQGELTRAEGAAVFMRLHRLLAGEDPDGPAAPEPQPGGAGFAVTTPSFSLSSSVYDDDVGDLEVGVIKLTDPEIGLTDQRYYDFYYSELVKYTFTTSDPEVIRVNENGGLYAPARLDVDDAPVTAVITVTREGGGSVQVPVTVSPRVGEWFFVDEEYLETYTAEVLRRTNLYRAEAGVRQLTYIHGAQDLANYRCELLSIQYSHALPNGIAPLVYIDEDGVEIGLGGENIGFIGVSYNKGAINFSPEALAQTAVDMWYNSPGHRDRMLLYTSKRMGTGLYVVNEGTPYDVTDTTNAGTAYIMEFFISY